MMSRNLKVVVWNSNGVKSKRNDLHFFLSDHDADIVLLSETHLQPAAAFTLPAYRTYRTDRAPRAGQARNPGGGTAVLVHQRIAHRECTIQTHVVESTGVFIHVGDRELLFHAVYLPPRAVAADGFRADLDTLFEAAEHVIVAGDLNAKHATWSRRGNPRGGVLHGYLDRRGDVDVVAPRDPTHYPANGTPDVLDFAMCKGVPFPIDIQATPDLSSDHVPLILTIHTSPTSRVPPGASSIKTNWNRFRALVAARLTPPPVPSTAEELDRSVADLHELLSNCVSDASSPAPPKAPREVLPRHLRDEVNKRRRLRRAWQQTRSPAAKRRFNLQNEFVKMLLDDFRTETWQTYLNSLDIESGSAWKAAKQLRGTKPTNHPLHGQQGLAYTASDKSEAFADTMEIQFQLNEDVYDEDQEMRIEHFSETFFDEPLDDHIEPFTLQEVQSAVAAAKPRKAPGLDRIGGRVLRAAPLLLSHVLLILFNSVLRLQHFPTVWKTAKIVLIPKPGKSRLYPQNYRPISLLPAISKLFEKLLLSRLSPFLDDFIRPEQFGFRRGHSTTLQLIRVVNQLVDNHNMNLCSVAVLLDVSKAFDKVWHDGLLFKLSESPIPAAAVHLIRSYLSGRSFKISVDGELSSLRPITAGVPQGSVLGPVLYLVYTNDLPTVPGVTLSLYADDALLHCRSARPALAARYMQRQMDELSPWLQKWRIKVNADKSDAICFRKRRKMPRAIPPPVMLDGEAIPWKPAVKYLGVTLDSKLNFGRHAERKIDEAKRIQGCLWPLISPRSPLPLRVKLMMFTMIVRSCLMYASTAWWPLVCRTTRQRIQSVQSKALRRITRQPWFVRNSVIHQSAGILPLEEFARANATCLFQRASSSGFPQVRDICVRFGIPEDGRPRPAAILDAQDPPDPP